VVELKGGLGEKMILYIPSNDVDTHLVIRFRHGLAKKNTRVQPRALQVWRWSL
jgi:hypothetical protein